MKSAKQKSSEKKELTQSKKRLFWAILLSFPVVFFVLLELFLRIIDYGGIPELVVRKTVSGKEYYTLNRSVASRYFTQKGIAIPEAFDDLFEIIKRPKTKRIFMIGESTMAGYPFDYNATGPRLLQDRLRSAFPDMNIEVVNVGLAAVNSYTILDLIRELVEYEPDAFILYLGHNEFYGAFGIGSTEYLGRWRNLVNLYIRLQRLRSFVLIRNGLSEAVGLFRHAPTPQEATVMEAMVRENTILYQSEDYRDARENFKANLEEIIAVAKDNGTPIVISTLTSNLRDQRPLLSAFSPVSSDSARRRWQDLMNKGSELMQAGRYASALDTFKEAQRTDSANAEGYFRAANCCDSLGLFNEAYRFYSLARDNDALRFRASEEFSILLRSIARKHSVPVADAERAFEEASPHRLVGNNLMLEHLHPTFEGYFLLAKVFFESLQTHHLVVDSSHWEMARILSDDELKQISGVTELTIESANIRVQSLVGRWPFKPAGVKSPDFAPVTHVQKIALDYVSRNIPWSSAHMRMAEWYKERTEYGKARAEYFAISKVAWYSYQPLMNMGDMERSMGRPFAAESLYLEAAELEPNPFVHVRLGMLYHDMDSLQKSIEQFEESLRAEENAKERFKPQDRAMARYFLGVVYGKQGNIARAKTNLELAVRIDPANEEARTLLSKIK